MAGKAGKRVGMLTARGVEAARKPGLFGDGGGLYLKVDVGGSKSWVFRHKLNGKTRKYGLGPTHTVALSDARERAEAIRRQLLDGIDPREARRTAQEAAAVAEAKSISFNKAVAEYIESHKAGWKSDKHAKQWQATLTTYAAPVFGRLPVSAIDTDLVLNVLSRSGPPRTKPRIGSVAALRWCWTGPKPKTSAAVITLRYGEAISNICFRRAPRCASPCTTPPCHTPSCRHSWPICAGATASPHWRWSSQSLLRLGPARRWARHGPSSI